MKILGLGRILSFTRKVQNRFGATAIILIYHRINEKMPDPLCLAVTPAHFSEQLSVLAGMTEPVALEDLSACLRTRTRCDLPLSAVTFDDGYADNLTEAAPILTEYSIPATVYVATSGICQSQEFYWDSLERILLRPGVPPSLSLEIGPKTYSWEFSGSLVMADPWNVRQPAVCEEQRAYHELVEVLLSLSPSRREDVLDQLFDWSGIDRRPRPCRRAMTEDELCELTANGLVTVGAHTVSHPVLSGLRTAEQALEINDARKRLEAILNRSIPTFSYPYGCRQHYTKETVELVRQSGFCCACSNFPGLVNRWTDPFQLPRCFAGNVDGREFEKRIRTVFEIFS